MKKIFLILCALFVLLVTGLYFYVQTLDISAYKARLIQEMSSVVNGKVTVQDIRLKGFSTLSVEGVSITTGSRLVASVNQIQLHLNLADLLNRRMNLTSVGVDGAKVNLFMIDGQLNLNTLIVPAQPAVPGNAPTLSMVSEDPAPIELLAEDLHLKDLTLLWEDNEVSRIEARGALKYPMLNVSQILVRPAKGDSVIKASAEVHLKSQAVALQILQGRVLVKDFAAYAAGVELPPVVLTITGGVTVKDKVVSPDISVVSEAAQFTHLGEKVQLEPMTLRISDKVSLLVVVSARGLTARADFKVHDYLQGIAGMNLKESRITAQAQLVDFQPEVKGQLDLDLNLEGLLNAITAKGVMSSRGILAPGFSEPLRVAGTFDGRIDALQNRLAFRDAVIQLEGNGKRSKINASFGYDGTKAYPQSVMLDLKAPEIYPSMFRKELQDFVIRDLYVKSGYQIGLNLHGKASRLRAEIDWNPVQTGFPSRMLVSGPLVLSDLHPFMQSLEIPLVRSRLDVQTAMENQNVVFAFSSQEVLIPVTDTMAPLALQNLQGAVSLDPVSLDWHLRQIRATVFSGQVQFQGKGNIDLIGKPHQFTGTIQGLDVKAMAAYGAESMRNHFAGTLNAQIARVQVLPPAEVGPPVLIEGNISLLKPEYYYHRSVADALDAVQSQIRQKFLAGLLKQESQAQQTNVRYSAFMDVEAVPFTLNRNRLTAGPARIQENRGDFRMQTQSVAVVLPPDDKTEGTVQTDLNVVVSNAFVRSKFPYMRDSYLDDVQFSVQVNGPFSAPVSAAEQGRLQGLVGETIGRSLDLGKAQAAVTQQVDRIKNLIRGDGEGSAKEQVQQEVNSRVEDKIRQSLTGVEKVIGTTETQKLQEKIQNKVTEGIFKLFKK